MSLSPTAYTVGKSDLVPALIEDTDRDPRGIVWMFEEPQRRATYVLGVDPTVGITGWSRLLRTQDDAKTDNAAIEVVRVGPPDVQVAEYAAPVDAEELASVTNTLGRVYAGSAEDNQALALIEVYPGMGIVTQRELISRYGYTHLPPWRYEDSLAPRLSNRFGWYSTRDSRKMLWSRGGRHLFKGHVRLYSPWLVEEMADCTPDNFLAVTGRAGSGMHDDRVVALLLALWAANEWSLTIEPQEAPAERSNEPRWQASEITADGMAAAWADKFNDLMEAGDSE